MDGAVASKGSQDMADEPLEMIVFADKEGTYYAIARSVWEGARVPDEYKGEVERLLGGPEVSGFSLNFTSPMQIGTFFMPTALHSPQGATGWSAA